jgi:hypothetical protein
MVDSYYQGRADSRPSRNSRRRFQNELKGVIDRLDDDEIASSREARRKG